MPSTCCNSSNLFLAPHPHEPTRTPVITITAQPKSPGLMVPRTREVMVVDCKSCRQLYLRSAYTFSREKEGKHDNFKERTQKCFRRIKQLPKGGFSSASLFSILRRLLACTSTAKVPTINRA